MKFIFTSFVLLCIHFLPTFSQNQPCLSHMSLGISFPPVTDSIQRNFTQPRLDELNVHHIRFAEEWAFREPSKGIFNWKPLDDRIEWANKHRYELWLTIQSNAATWACSGIKNAQSCVFKNNNDFKSYVDTLFKRYPGKIAKIQFGNEWQTDYWYKGNAQQYIDATQVLYTSAKQYSPSSKVVLGGFTTFSLRALALCEGKIHSIKDDDGQSYTPSSCSNPQFLSTKSRIDSVLTYAKYDMIDLHFYDDVENWGVYYQNFKDTITKPILVSEFGGPNLNYELPYSDSLQAHRLRQYVKVLDSLQIKEAYYFKLVEGGNAVAAHQKSGLIDSNLILKPAYQTFKSFAGCITQLDNVPQVSDIRLFPNPMRTSCLLTCENPENHPLSLSIFNPEGKLIHQSNSLSGNQIRIENPKLSSGWYYVVLRSDYAPYAVQKLIVE